MQRDLNPFNIDPLVTHHIEGIGHAISALENMEEQIKAAHDAKGIEIIQWQIQFLSNELKRICFELTGKR